MSLAAVAAGAAHLMVEVHTSPKEALCDGPQSLVPEKFLQMIAPLRGGTDSWLHPLALIGGTGGRTKLQVYLFTFEMIKTG